MFPVANARFLPYEGRMDESAPTPRNDPLAPVKAQLYAAFQLLIKPHTMPFHIAAMAIAGLLTGVFIAITLLIVIVATNFNVLGWIE
jgi:hypothetical protein